MSKVLAWLLIAASTAVAAEWKAGVAKITITPQEPVWMGGYGSRDKPSEGTAQQLYAKALAIEDPNGGRVVIVTTDILGLGRDLTESMAARIREEHGVARERLVITSSHTHAGPAIRGNLPTMYDMSPEQEAAFNRYPPFLRERVASVVSQALADLSAARLSFHRGQAGFAMNRREKTGKGYKLGVNPDGPVDHDVPVLRVTSPDGRLRAVLFSYACHNTTLGGDFYQFHGDYAGSAQETIEKTQPGVIALFMSGCGGDANPHPRGKLEMARRHGRTLAQAVADAAAQEGKPVSEPLSAAFERVSIPLAPAPSKREFEERLNHENRFYRRHARMQLDILAQQGQLPKDYPYPIQIVGFGPAVSLVALGGEVVVDYALRLKDDLGPSRTWVVAYANDVMAYIPSKRVLLEGGYEADRSMIYYGMPGKWAPELEKIIINKVRQLAKKVRR